jgi:hypothetical protein
MAMVTPLRAQTPLGVFLLLRTFDVVLWSIFNDECLLSPGEPFS